MFDFTKLKETFAKNNVIYHCEEQIDAYTYKVSCEHESLEEAQNCKAERETEGKVIRLIGTIK